MVLSERRDVLLRPDRRVYSVQLRVSPASSCSLSLTVVSLFHHVPCRCVDGYMGQRCEFKDLEGSYLREYLRNLSPSPRSV